MEQQGKAKTHRLCRRVRGVAVEGAALRQAQAAVLARLQLQLRL